MKKEEYTRKDGTKGENLKLEAGDKVTSRYSEPRENNTGQYPVYSLGVTLKEGEEAYIQLTKTQYEKLKGAGDLTGKTIEAYSYKNEHGEFVGVKVA